MTAWLYPAMLCCASLLTFAASFCASFLRVFSSWSSAVWTGGGGDGDGDGCLALPLPLAPLALPLAGCLPLPLPVVSPPVRFFLGWGSCCFSGSYWGPLEFCFPVWRLGRTPRASTDPRTRGSKPKHFPAPVL